MAPFTLRCSSCAVVSSSGTLLGQGAGQEIDRHSCVIRMNMAPVEGYQNDVGERTSLRVMNFFMFNVNPYELPPNSQIMVWGLLPRKSHLENAQTLMRSLSAGSTIYGQTMQGEIEADQLFAEETGRKREMTNSWLSTGWFTLMIALEICQETHVYGMVPSYYCTMNGTADVPYHYYDSPWNKQCATYKDSETNSKGAHRFMTEKAVFARWAVKYNLSFHHPEWTIDRENLTRLDTPFVRSTLRRK
ncbi:alpha-N-acetyl-neuraminyl-2,3-beta-galactosyl-1,3-N-acetyl-galactosaminide alpha-2,6-sialyltransferase-like [Patiria miniata]|uniref:Uncharacterized protein n=1 Tax=Patiria miniata TaxID=46514 RepID=A0A914B2Z1_PATMI|nr:alpha-N-acetyl-neuraminyl-2,3-beta-galactosyl-1,3-N-acetyl-galactosaminide alpha-2,6-sialyltransferase-like [Patiria miniata]